MISELTPDAVAGLDVLARIKLAFSHDTPQPIRVQLLRDNALMVSTIARLYKEDPVLCQDSHSFEWKLYVAGKVVATTKKLKETKEIKPQELI